MTDQHKPLAEAEIAAGLELCEKASPGPWRQGGEGNRDCIFGPDDWEIEESYDDISFIAEARELLPRALREVERLRELESWIVSRWDAEVAHRPLHNVNYRTLDDTWRQVYRHVSGGQELPR